MDRSIPIIQVNNLTKSYQKQTVLEDISFTVSSGSVLAIIGPNGAGKSTLVKMLLGLEAQTSGSVRIDGQKPEAVRERIGYVPQRFTFDRTVPITVHEFLMLAACEEKEHSRTSVVDRALQEVGLPHIGNQQLGALSGGQFQRVMIARAIMHHKDILILDEPATGVDIAAEKTIYDFIRKLNEERGVTVLLISHELDIVFRFATQVICLNKRLVCHGVPKQVITKDVLQEMYGHLAGAYHHHCEK